MTFMKKAAGAVIAATFAATGAMAETTLRMQTHFTSESNSGKLLQGFVDNIEAMSGGDLKIEMFYSSAVVKSVEGFDAASSGILDCEMHGGAYQTGKNPAFQFVGDIMGGYATPYQQLSWLYYGGGLEAAQELYNQYNMQLIGWWVPGQESFASTRPIASVEDLKGWKFRSPPGMETLIFEKLGASPIVMDFTEIFTALETGIIDGADASSLANNQALGLYDIAKHANYPGFHSMPSDHLACNKDVFESLSPAHQALLKVGMESLALRTALQTEVANAQAVAELEANGVTIHAWPEEELKKFRTAAQAAWGDFATTPEAKALVESHSAYLRQLGLLD